MLESGHLLPRSPRLVIHGGLYQSQTYYASGRDLDIRSIEWLDGMNSNVVFGV